MTGRDHQHQHNAHRAPIPPVRRRRKRPGALRITPGVRPSTDPRHRFTRRLNGERQSTLIQADAHPMGGLFSSSQHAPEPARPSRRFRRPGRRGERVAASDELPSLLNDVDFRTLWLSRLLSQTAQGALLYAMLILVVDLSDRTVYSSLFVLSSIIPSVIFGLPAGVVVDAVPRRGLLVVLNLLRFAFMLSLVSTSDPSLGGVFAATIGIWVIHQFYSTGEASVMGSIIPPSRYTAAQALFNLALTIAQAIGLVMLAPLLLRAGGPRLVFAFAGLLFLSAAVLTALLPAVRHMNRLHVRRRRNLRDILGEGWRFVRGDRQTFEAILDDVLISIGMSALVVIMPYYLERVLDTSKENTVFVFAPAALGLVLGLRTAPLLGRMFGERLVATGALFAFGGCVGALGFVHEAYNLLTLVFRLPLDRIADTLSISPLILVAMLISIPAGFASALVNVAARSILLTRAPEQVRGQVIATQGLVGSIGALIPTLLAGIATDIFGVQPIAVAIALSIMIVALAAHTWGRRPPLPVETAQLA